METMPVRCSTPLVALLLSLAVWASEAAIMEVGDVTTCPAEGDMYDCRELSIDLDDLLVAEEVIIEGSAPLVGLLFGRDITISRDQVYESHMYTYTTPRGAAAFLYDNNMGYGELSGNIRVGRRFLQVQNCGEKCHVLGRVHTNAPRLFSGGRGEWSDSEVKCKLSDSLNRQSACTNGDALSFAECWAAKQLGFCSANLWLTQCEASCGNECCGDSNFDSCEALAGLTFSGIKLGCDLFQGNTLCRESCDRCS